MREGPRALCISWAMHWTDSTYSALPQGASVSKLALKEGDSEVMAKGVLGKHKFTFYLKWNAILSWNSMGFSIIKHINVFCRLFLSTLSSVL